MTTHVIHVQNRKRLVNAMLAVGIIFWSAVVSSIQTLSKVDTIAQVRLSLVCVYKYCGLVCPTSCSMRGAYCKPEVARPDVTRSVDNVMVVCVCVFCSQYLW